MTKPILSLIDKYDDRVDINGTIYQIDMRLDTVMRFIELLEDKKVPEILKLKQGLRLMIDDDLAGCDIETRLAVLTGLIEHVSNGSDNKTYDLKGNLIPTPYREPITDYYEDFDYIYAGFIQTYSIDLLEQRDLDWRKFLALLKSLPKNTKYREVIDIRTMDTKGYKGEELAKIREAKAAVALKGRG